MKVEKAVSGGGPLGTVHHTMSPGAVRSAPHRNGMVDEMMKAGERAREDKF